MASDHVIESFRNDLWAGYKTGEGMDPEIVEQIPVMERALAAAGFTVWPMVELEADDALGAAAAVADGDERVDQVLIVTADKDLGQCVVGERIVQFDRRKREIIDEAGVIEKFGVGPESIPDYLGLVGDTADGFPGLPGLGRQERRPGAGPVRPSRGHPGSRPASGMSPACAAPPSCRRRCRRSFEDALLFRQIATIDTDVDVGTVDDWDWTGPTADFAAVADEIGAPRSRGPGTPLWRTDPVGPLDTTRHRRCSRSSRRLR